MPPLKVSDRLLAKCVQKLELSVPLLAIFYPFVIRVSTFVWEKSNQVRSMGRNRGERDGNGLKSKGEHNCDGRIHFRPVAGSESKKKVDFCIQR